MNKIIGQRIKDIRKNKGMSQEDLAYLLNISQSAYQRIESGETNSWAAHLLKISEILDIRPEDLVADSSNSFNNAGQSGGLAFQYIGSINTVNSISDKLIEQYEKRIEDLTLRLKNLENNSQNNQ